MGRVIVASTQVLGKRSTPHTSLIRTLLVEVYPVEYSWPTSTRRLWGKPPAYSRVFRLFLGRVLGYPYFINIRVPVYWGDLRWCERKYDISTYFAILVRMVLEWGFLEILNKILPRERDYGVTSYHPRSFQGDTASTQVLIYQVLASTRILGTSLLSITKTARQSFFIWVSSGT